ncbi:MAG: CBS domain-containing protein [Gemmatimonadales bacterium]|nr:MAG: CBS domain-containing protein [Gemmatimonadales bacterium]
MKLGDLLFAERIRIPLRARTLRDAVLETGTLFGPTEGSPFGGSAYLQLGASPSGLTRMGSATDPGRTREPSIALGVAPRPLEVEGLSEGETGPRIILLVLLPVGVERDVRFRMEAAFSHSETEAAILRSGSSEQLLGLRRLTEIELKAALRVEDVMEPVSYRIYADTPLDEVLDLIVRRRLSTVPVVGEGLQVRGIITADEILRYALRSAGSRPKPGENPPLASDVMSRSVMCVSDDELLDDAAQLMANRHVDQLPVVRDGEFVGFLKREDVLSALFGPAEVDGGRD